MTPTHRYCRRDRVRPVADATRGRVFYRATVTGIIMKIGSYGFSTWGTLNGIDFTEGLL